MSFRTDEGRKPNKHFNARRKAREARTNTLYLEASTLADLGLEGVLKWAQRNKLRAATLELSNKTTLRGNWSYLPAAPGRRESLSLVKGDDTSPIALSGIWLPTNSINPQIRSITGHTS